MAGSTCTNISKPGCYYTDTDSILVNTPVPDGDTSDTELGKLKLECGVKEGICLAPKCYALRTEEEKLLIRHKGPAKNLVDFHWFSDLARTKSSSLTANLGIDWGAFPACRDKPITNGLFAALSAVKVVADSDISSSSYPRHACSRTSTKAFTETCMLYIHESFHRRDIQTTHARDLRTVCGSLRKTQGVSKGGP